MAKFYVTSGTLNLVVLADDANKAALWSIHRAMQQILPIYDDMELLPAAKAELARAQGCWVLDDQILVSEIGFDRDDVATLDTAELVSEWNQLMIAISKIEDCFTRSAV